MKFQKAIIFAVRFPESSGGATYVENLSASFRSAGIATEVLSLYPGNLSSSTAKNRTLFKNERLARQPIRRFLQGPVHKKIFQALKLLSIKKIQIFLARRKIKRLENSLDELTLLVFTHVRTKTVLESLGFKPHCKGSRLVGQHHSPFISIEEDTSLREEMVESFSDVNYFTALSVEDAQKFSDLLKVPSYSIPNPRPNLSHTDETKDWSQREKKAVILARFSEEKRVSMAIKLFAEARQAAQADDWVLEIYGDGELCHELEDLISDLGAQEYISLRGVTSSPLEILSQARVNLITSRYEGFGMTILEAACVGTPSICFAVSPGVSELSKTLGTVLIKDGDTASYIDSLKQILSDSPNYPLKSQELMLNSEFYSERNILHRWTSMVQ